MEYKGVVVALVGVGERGSRGVVLAWAMSSVMEFLKFGVFWLHVWCLVFFLIMPWVWRGYSS
jgi:hypothetical protein